MSFVTKSKVVLQTRSSPDPDKKHGSLHYQALDEELRGSEKVLDGLYKQSQNAAFKFKSLFCEIENEESNVEMLRQKYYSMLEKKIFDEKCRDMYFNGEQRLVDLKDLYIAESQKLAHEHSQYIAYSNTSAKRRETCVGNLLKDTEILYQTLKRIETEKNSLQEQLAELQNMNAINNTINKSLLVEKETLQTCVEKLGQEKFDLTEWGNTLKEQCKKFKISEENFCIDIKQLTASQAKLSSALSAMQEENVSLKDEIMTTQMSHNQLKDEISKCQQIQGNLQEELFNLKKSNEALKTDKLENLFKIQTLRSEINECQTTKKKFEEQRDLFKEAFKQVKKEKDHVLQNCEKIMKEKERFKEQYIELQNERDMVGRAKDRSVTKEYQTRVHNEDLTEAHKCLTTELGEIRYKLQKFEERAKKDCKIKYELRDTIKRLHRDIEDERKKMIKVTKEIRVQTDPDLACENTDIAIQHARFKMVQGLKDRNRAFKDNVNMHIERNRLTKEVKKNKLQIIAKQRFLWSSKNHNQLLKVKINELEKSQTTLQQRVKQNKQLAFRERSATKENLLATDNHCSSADVISSIASKLKYYFEKKRREDGFDLSPASLPIRVFPKLLPKRLLQSNPTGLPLKHHFSHSHIRRILTIIQSTKSCEKEWFVNSKQKQRQLETLRIAAGAVLGRNPSYNKPVSNSQQVKIITNTPPPVCTRNEAKRIAMNASGLINFLEYACGKKHTHEDIGCTKLQRLKKLSNLQAAFVPHIHK